MAGQGVTGREDNKIISDSVLEVETNREEDEEEEGGSDTGEDSQDSDDDGFVMYSVAGKEDYVPVEVKKKQKTKAVPIEEENSEANDWSQEQQKCFEVSLKQFPKGTSERWDRIAGLVLDTFFKPFSLQLEGHAV